ncbi:MAG: hypothetical protein M3R58_18210, partial [Pseudomonadota bacterium]|nr:hypothetical protein [Pseudomonadota bacterium]
LRSGLRANAGPSLYLPQAPIDAAFRSLVAEFHGGRIVPSEGCTADFRIEEHVAVLDLLRRGLRASRSRPAARAQRQATDRLVELYIGLGEITARGFTPAAPRAAAIVLASKDGVARTPIRNERERDLALDEIYDPTSRRVTLANVSETGLGLEGSLADCGALAVGDLVAVRISSLEPLVIAKVMRCIPATTPGRVVIGVSRISSLARPVEVTSSASRGTRTSPMLYVPGDEASGCRDAYLVGERTFEEGGALEVPAGDHLYRFRFNRVRGRGRGWVLGGFEIISVRSTARAAASSF